MSDRSPAVEAFIEDIIAVFRKHGMSLGHEDSQGAFEVCRLSEDNIRWLRDAYDRVESND